MQWILLIEEDRKRADVLARVLRQRGYTLTVVTTGEEAVSQLRQHPQDFDIAILDLSRDREEDWCALSNLHKALHETASAAVILGFSLVNRGTRMRLEAERRGARFVYEHYIAKTR